MINFKERHLVLKEVFQHIEYLKGVHGSVNPSDFEFKLDENEYMFDKDFYCFISYTELMKICIKKLDSLLKKEATK